MLEPGTFLQEVVVVVVVVLRACVHVNLAAAYKLELSVKSSTKLIQTCSCMFQKGSK